jgi:hypothetical protein
MVWNKWKPNKIILPTPIGTSLVLVLELGATIKMQLNMVKSFDKTTIPYIFNISSKIEK